MIEKASSHGLFLSHAENTKNTEATSYARACRPDGTYERQRRMLCVLCDLCVQQNHSREREIQSYRSKKVCNNTSFYPTLHH